VHSRRAGRFRELLGSTEKGRGDQNKGRNGLTVGGRQSKATQGSCKIKFCLGARWNIVDGNELRSTAPRIHETVDKW
jgi:hypothetical protein